MKMKNVSLLLVLLFISSCCATAQVAEEPEKNITQLEEKVTIENIAIISKTIVEDSQIPEPHAPTELIEIDEGIDDYDSEAFNHDLWNDLLQKNVSKDGNVNYKSFKNDPIELHIYINSLGENMPTDKWNNEDKLAYWINAYNAMTIDLIVRNYPVKSIQDIKDPWDQRLWKLGNKWYNLNEIEHQILRKMNEPRIHFGIVCASYSCPKLQNEAFTALQLEAQLTMATREFLADPNRNNITSDNIKISKIFKWFSKDFKQSGGIIDFLNQYSDVKISSKAKTSFKDYNWDLNE
jgi:hypothetical protein